MKTQILPVTTSKTKRKRLPSWAKKKLGQPSSLHKMKATLRERGLSTVCESARCPNIGECFTKPTATFMILGSVCTRGCGFCSINKDLAPSAANPNEPTEIAKTTKELGLKHVVVTSVTRDDLADGGASQFVLTIQAIRDIIPSISIEVLVPDFAGNDDALASVLEARPEIFNHNIETVKRLYKVVRPGARYERSLEILKASNSAGLLTKSGLMVGLGESAEEVEELLRDLHFSGVDAVTIGQYLQPSASNLEVIEYIEPERFAAYEAYGLGLGISKVYSGPLVRSSYNAAEVFDNIRENIKK
jgi:lipoic acid synthetase